MTTEHEPTTDADDASDAQSTVTSEREVTPTHGGPGTNWTGVVAAIIALVVLVTLGWMFLAA